MPEMNGRELAELLKTHCPGMKILFMSGYTASVIVNRGVLGDNSNFIQKPFSLKELAVKVRDVLDQK
jgi:DNA-binding NtrC family response regulator